MNISLDNALSDAHPKTKGQPAEQISNSEILSLIRICKTFTVKRNIFETPGLLKAVNDVSLSLGSRETIGIVGESGCGKSTLGRIACGLLAPDSGEIRIDNMPMAGPGQQKIQMIFQDSSSALNPRRNIGSSIREPLDVSGEYSKAEAHEKVLNMLDLVGLSHEQANRYPHEFSGGQRQRIVVARALIKNPQIIVCDEPVSSLDASVQAQVLNLLKDLQEQFDLSYLFISHDLGVVGHMSDRVAVMYLGRIVELAPVLDIFKNPAHPYTQALLTAQPGSRYKAHNPAWNKHLLGEQQSKIKLLGDPPSPVNLPNGCPLHPRCPYAMPVCKEILPKLTAVSGHTHLAACHLNC